MDKIIEEYRGIRDLVAAQLLTDTLEELTYDTPFPVAGIAELTKSTENSSLTPWARTPSLATAQRSLSLYWQS